MKPIFSELCAVLTDAICIYMYGAPVMFQTLLYKSLESGGKNMKNGNSPQKRTHTQLWLHPHKLELVLLWMP